jgi:hypothetical protein
MFLSAILAGLSPTPSLGMAEFNTFFGLPAGLQNDTVRIGTNTGGGLVDAGTGSIIAIMPDASGTGQLYCVLTADHVMRGANQAGISFGNGNNDYMFTTTNFAAQVRLLAPVDLAVFSVDIPNNAKVPQVLIPTIMAPNNNQIIQAGYGERATVGVVPSGMAGQMGYNVTLGSYGTFDNGTSAINLPLNPGYTRGIYAFNALQSTLQFTTDAMGNITSGPSYQLSGDSGGPTFQSNNMGGLALVGSHSASTAHIIRNAMGQRTAEYNINGDTWTDVNDSQYVDLINRSCRDVSAAAPEPSTLTLDAIGVLVGLGYVRCRRRRARA